MSRGTTIRSSYLPVFPVIRRSEPRNLLAINQGLLRFSPTNSLPHRFERGRNPLANAECLVAVFCCPRHFQAPAVFSIHAAGTVR
jgi:hypothetical protein